MLMKNAQHKITHRVCKICQAVLGKGSGENKESCYVRVADSNAFSILKMASIGLPPAISTF